MVEEAGEVAVVEVIGRGRVERREVAVVATTLWAVASQRRREGPVDVGVGVDPVSVILALPPADGVPPCSNVDSRGDRSVEAVATELYRRSIDASLSHFAFQCTL